MCANSALTPWDLAEQNILFPPKNRTQKSQKEEKQKFCHVTPGLPNNQFFLIISLLIFIFRSHSIIF